MVQGTRKQFFLSEKPDGISDKILLTIPEKQIAIDTKRLDEEIVAISENLLEYKCITPTQHKKFSF